MGNEPLALYALQLVAAAVEVTALGLLVALAIEAGHELHRRVLAFLHRGEL